MTHAALPRAAFDGKQQAVCGAAGSTLSGARGFARRPYLQRTTAEGVALLWTTPVEAAFAVEIVDAQGERVAAAEAIIDSTADLPEGRQWIAEIQGLQAATTYCYRVLADGAAWTAPTGFTTAPLPGSSAPVRFAALGDLGTQTLDQYAVLEQLEQVPIEFMVFTGDLAYDDGKLHELESNVFDVYDDVMATAPLFPASGNHDYRTADGIAFRQAFALFENGGEAGHERWYSFDWGDVHIAVIDTEKIGPEQLLWLDDDLAGTDRSVKIAIGHRPPYSSGFHGSDHEVRAHFVPLFAEHGVSLALFGHDHDYERTEPFDGVTYIVTGGGGHGTREVGRKHYTAYADAVAHFVFIEVDAGTVRAVAVDATGRAFDSVKI